MTTDQKAAACVAAFQPLADAARGTLAKGASMERIDLPLDDAADVIDAMIRDVSRRPDLPIADVGLIHELLRMAKRDIERARTTVKLAVGRRDELAAAVTVAGG
jgi:hypothetical protein